jgi:phosphate uptake regulator
MGNEFLEELERMSQLLTSDKMLDDADEILVKRNKTAAIRVRKKLMEVIKACGEMRKDIQLFIYPPGRVK